MPWYEALIRLRPSPSPSLFLSPHLVEVLVLPVAEPKDSEAQAFEEGLGVLPEEQ